MEMLRKVIFDTFPRIIGFFIGSRRGVNDLVMEKIKKAFWEAGLAIWKSGFEIISRNELVGVDVVQKLVVKIQKIWWHKVPPVKLKR